MADNARGIHVSPGVYSREIELNYAVKSLGITTLGLVGETQRGPAFQPMPIQNWREFEDTFGGTSTEKFVGSQYPKYELPYIAKSYLSESNQLEVCRVLGLSGYNAGPAWLLTAPYNDTEDGKSKNMVVAVLRARGDYKKYVTHKSTSDCGCASSEYDKLVYDVAQINYNSEGTGYCRYPHHSFGDAIQLVEYIPYASTNPCAGINVQSGATKSFNVMASDYGHFKVIGIMGEIDSSDIVDGKGQELAEAIAGGKETLSASTFSAYADNYFEYAVSLNPSDKDYILNVLGTNPQDGSAPVYVESLYDAAYQSMVDGGYITQLNQSLSFYDNYNIKDFCQLKPVFGLISKKEEELTRKDVGKRFLVDTKDFTTCHMYNYSGGTFETTSGTSGVTFEAVSGSCEVGDIFTVKQFTDYTGTRHYYYAKIDDATTDVFSGNSASGQSRNVAKDKLIDLTKESTSLNSPSDSRVAALVKNNGDGYYYRLDDGVVVPVTCDLNNYKSAYRFASTPWIVSNIKGDYNTAELHKLFRFHTISDGSTANNEIKISIANIRPDDGTFDVFVRDINDTDGSISKLESFTKCNLIPGSSRYLGYLIGTYNGEYEVKSKYITVEINENITTQSSSPAGFLGYPLPAYDGETIYEIKDGSDDALTKNWNVQDTKLALSAHPVISYNTQLDKDVKHKRQYFGLTNLPNLGASVDIDLFTFKGNASYPADANDEPIYLTPGFHLDSRLNSIKDGALTVEGISGYKFETVSESLDSENFDGPPVIGTEAEMADTPFSYVDLRKFTVYFYGGFDGWDDYRDARSNTDEFKSNKYKGEISNSSLEGYAFDYIKDPTIYKINENNPITSDYYAYLSGIRQFANPEEVDINVFATPGIDIINNTFLTEDTIDMIEEERADSIYVATLPDKPYGAEDYVDEMYTPDDIIDELESTDIDSNYTCVYYPWVKYYDADNYQYINLPVTKDVVRNMALTDNTTQPWFAPAGISRGDVSCEHAHYITTLGDEDTLYEGRVNPVKTFANDGVKLWGQKNLQIKESQLNRIAVRRLLLRMRKLVAIACRNLIFEPNDSTTKASFISTVTPIMDNIKANRGVSDYKIEVNDTVESRERRELPAKIYFKPYNALEYITLDFIVTPEGVDFDNI